MSNRKVWMKLMVGLPKVLTPPPKVVSRSQFPAGAKAHCAWTTLEPAWPAGKIPVTRLAGVNRLVSRFASVVVEKSGEQNIACAPLVRLSKLANGTAGEEKSSV